MQSLAPLPIKSVFPDLIADELTLEKLLEQLSRTETILAICTLKLSIYRLDGTHIDQSSDGFLKQFFNDKEIRAIRKYERTLQAPHKSQGLGLPNQTLAVFGYGGLNTLISYVCRYCSDDVPKSNYNDDKSRKMLVKACLIAEQLWDRNIHRNWGDIDGTISVDKDYIPGTLRRNAMESSPPSSRFLHYLGRARIIFREYFPKYYPNFDKLFHDFTQLNVESYHHFLTLFIFWFYKYRETMLKSAISHKHDEIERFLQLEAHSIDELNLGKDDLSFLRNKPLLQLANDSVFVLDMGFLIEKAVLGLVFHVPREIRNDLFTQLGYAFENYVKDIFKRVYRPSSGLAQRFFHGDILKTHSENGEIEITDAILIDAENIAFFEIKSKLVPDNILLDHDFKKKLLRKYRNDNDIVQLASTINKIISGNIGLDSKILSQQKKIFPVLVVTDKLMGLIEISGLFADDFESQFQPDEVFLDGRMRKGDFIIYPYIIITLDLLEYLEGALRHFSLFDLLHDYSMWLSKEWQYRKFWSLGDFIEITGKYKLKIKNTQLDYEWDKLEKEFLKYITP